MTGDGAILFARYAYPPNELGYCGPDGAADLLRADTAEIARRARLFDGAWSYLEVIAECGGITDPLDARVVEAYWVGNDLLDAVPPGLLVDRLLTRFHDQRGGTWRDAGARAVAHHSFQVFEVYPWAALLAATGRPTALAVLDRCRIRTGTVVDVGDGTATVRSHPLAWDGATVTPGPAREEPARSLIGDLAPGDRVALHWDWVCDRLTARQYARLDRQEAATVGAVSW